jgi:hypothetical protein
LLRGIPALFPDGIFMRGWAYSWMFLLMIPVIITAGEAIK